MRLFISRSPPLPSPAPSWVVVGGSGRARKAAVVWPARDVGFVGSTFPLPQPPPSLSPCVFVFSFVMISCLPFRFLLAFLSFRRGGCGEEVLCGRGSHVAAARALQFAAFSFDPLRAFGEQRQPVAHALYLTLNVFAPPVSARRRHLVAQPALTNQRALKFLHFARFRDPFFCFVFLEDVFISLHSCPTALPSQSWSHVCVSR